MVGGRVDVCCGAGAPVRGLRPHGGRVKTRPYGGTGAPVGALRPHGGRVKTRPYGVRVRRLVRVRPHGGRTIYKRELIHETIYCGNTYRRIVPTFWLAVKLTSNFLTG